MTTYSRSTTFNEKLNSINEWFYHSLKPYKHAEIAMQKFRLSKNKAMMCIYREDKLLNTLF